MNKEREKNTNAAQVRDGFMKHSRSAASILPPPSVLESYEEIAPGMVDQLVKMVQREQEYRQSVERQQLKIQVVTLRVQQFVFCLISLAILYTTLLLSDSNIYLASITCIVSFSFVLLSLSILGRTLKTVETMTSTQHGVHAHKLTIPTHLVAGNTKRRKYKKLHT